MQRAVLIMFIAMSCIPAGDSAGKLLSGQLDVSPLFVASSRFLIGAIMVLPFMPKGTLQHFRDWRMWLRGGTLAMGITAMQMAVQTEEIANVFAAFFVGPLISYVLAVLFLREKVTWLRSILILLGFAGVIIVIRPGAGMSTGLLWAVGAGTCYGAFLTQSRWLAAVAPPFSMIFLQLSISSLLLLPLGLMTLPTFTGQVIGLTLASAFFSMLGNLLLLFAYQLAPASRLAPLVYFQLIAAVVLGWSIFGDLPDIWTWTGLLIILSTGLWASRLR